MMNPNTFICKPTLFKSLIYIYPPSINDVLDTKMKFAQSVQALTVCQEDIWDMIRDKTSEDGEPIESKTPFEMLMINAYHSKELQQIIMDAFKFFTREEVRIIPEEKMVIFTANMANVKDVKDLRMLQEEDYFDFQNCIRQAIGDKEIEPPVIDEDPRVARIKAKARERDRIKKKQGSKNGISLTTSMAALCCMGIGINPLNIGEISYASLGRLIKMKQDKEKYEADVQFLAGGADAKKLKPKYWIREQKD